MARTIKRGLDYFPFDVDFFQDIRIRKLIKYQGGKAVTVYALLLCTIYKNGYYAKWDKELPFIISEQSGYTEAYIQEVIDCCMNIGLLSKQLFESDKVLTSKGIQERYRAICCSSRRNCLIDEYNLIDNTATVLPLQEKQTNIHQQPDTPKQRQSKATPPRHVETPVPPPPAPTTAQKYSLSINDEIAEMKKSAQWKESVRIRYQLSNEQVDAYLADFALKCDKLHTSMQDARSHFCYWLQKQPDSKKSTPPPQKTNPASPKKEKKYRPAVDSAAELRDYLASRGLDPAATDLSKVAAADSAADFAKIPK